MAYKEPPKRKNKPYTLKEKETRGIYTKKEPRVCILFWKEHKMEDIEGLSAEELDKVIEAFYEKYQARNIKREPRWWYPDSPIDRVVDYRHNF